MVKFTAQNHLFIPILFAFILPIFFTFCGVSNVSAGNDSYIGNYTSLNSPTPSSFVSTIVNVFSNIFVSTPSSESFISPTEKATMIHNTVNILEEFGQEVAQYCVNMVSNYKGICNDAFDHYCKEIYREDGGGFTDHSRIPAIIAAFGVGVLVGAGGVILFQKIKRCCYSRLEDNVQYNQNIGQPEAEDTSV